LHPPPPAPPFPYTTLFRSNKAGTYIQPTIAATSAAATGVAVPADLGISTINSPNASAYPIASQTFLDVYRDPCKSGGASTTVARSEEHTSELQSPYDLVCR